MATLFTAFHFDKSHERVQSTGGTSKTLKLELEPAEERAVVTPKSRLFT